MEQTQRMTGHDNERLLVGQLLKILLDETVLHPVLADLTGLAVGDQLVGIERNVKVKVVVDHDLNGTTLDALALVLVNGVTVQLALGTEAVAVDAAVLFQLPGKFLRHLSVMVGMDIAQGVLNGKRLVRLGQMGFAAGRAAIAGFHLGIFWQLIVQLNGHGFACEIDHRYILTFLSFFLAKATGLLVFFPFFLYILYYIRKLL